MRLTGQFNFKQSLFGRLVLYVEEERRPVWPWARPDAVRRRWRRARVMDLTRHELRGLVDLGHRQHYLGLARPLAAPAPSGEELGSGAPRSTAGLDAGRSRAAA